jgi:26S proteasome regulatory subunit N4
VAIFPSPGSPQSSPSENTHYVMISSDHHHQQHQLYQPQPQPHYIPRQLRTQHHQPAISQPRYNTSVLFSFGTDQPLFDFQAEQYQAPMKTESNTWGLTNGQLTPTSTTRAHHRESSLSSLGSAGPASPYTANLSNPQVAGDIYHDYQDYQQSLSKPLTPAHTPSQEHFLAPQYTHFYQNSNLPFGMPQETKSNADLMPALEFNQSGRPSVSSVATRDSPSTPPSSETERRNNAYRNTVPKLDRTMTDVYSDELYRPEYSVSSASHTSVPAPTVTISPQNDIFSQRLQAANHQHLSASNAQIQTAIPQRERSPFRQGSPLAPTSNSFAAQTNARFGTATHMREQQKAQADARALQQQIQRASPDEATPNTISPKDVDLVYHENDEDANTPLFPQQHHQSPQYRQQPTIAQELEQSDDVTSQRSYGSMATSRRESSSAYSATSQATPQATFNFSAPAVPGGVRRIPQQYPFVPQSRRQTSHLSNVTEEFPATLTSMESSSSEYAAESSDMQKPSGASADTGTYTCTYHGCTLRFDTPAKLQRHKREGHRNSAPGISGAGDESGMTSAAQRNSQAGPHKCERINPSTGKPCNTIFSRPYDLTRHEDTIHNARKQKVHCPICTEEKSFSRNDALTRHMRVVHPQYADQQANRRRRGGS